VKTAREMVDEIARSVRPPRGVTIRLTEWPSDRPNWRADASNMERHKSQIFAAHVYALEHSDPIVDWSAVLESENGRRVAMTAP
jgi:hypothetical protein